MRAPLFALLLFGWLPLGASAQEGARVDGEPGVRMEADSAFGSPVWDIAYGPLEANMLDLWLPADSDGPHPLAVFFHGGGFGRGDKNGLDSALRDPLLARGFAVASVNYRLAPHARFPAPMEDAARAVQFLRAHAGEYGLDPDHFTTLGRSSGGALALWVAYNEDIAVPDAADPVARESTRVQGAGVINAQTTFRMKDLRNLFGADRPPTFFANLLGKGKRSDAAEAERASPLAAFSEDDPPAFFIYIEEKAKAIKPSRPHTFMHSRVFAEPVEQRAAKWGIDVEVVEAPNRDLPAAYEEMADFLAARVD